MIEFKQLSKTYVVGDSEVKALDHINLQIAAGEFVGIIGPSGSGKSTMMHIMGCLDKPTAGEYLLEGRSVEDYSDNELATTRNKRIGFVFQSFNLLSKMTIFDNVELPLVYQGVKASERRKRVNAALEQVDLASRAYHTPNAISGGQQQRAAIARAIVTDPAIILADEPTGNLDQETGHEIMQVFRDLNANGRTVILITHDNEVASQAHRCIRLIDGRIVEDVQTLVDRSSSGGISRGGSSAQTDSLLPTAHGQNREFCPSICADELATSPELAVCKTHDFDQGDEDDIRGVRADAPRSRYRSAAGTPPGRSNHDSQSPAESDDVVDSVIADLMGGQQ